MTERSHSLIGYYNNYAERMMKKRSNVAPQPPAEISDFDGKRTRKEWDAYMRACLAYDRAKTRFDDFGKR